MCFKSIQFTVKKVSVFGVFLVPVFPHMDTFNTMVLIGFLIVCRVRVRVYNDSAFAYDKKIIWGMENL